MGSERRESIVLVGYRATGKSTVGRLVAERLGWEFVDSDGEVVRRSGREIGEIFANDGEAKFRELEAEAVRALAGRERQVMATGGGAVLGEGNRRAIGEAGMVVHLAGEPETLAARLARDPAGRPSLTGMGLIEEVGEILRQRLPIYREVADVVVATDELDAEGVAEEVVRLWRVERGAK
jgi:shikimate kinase